MNLLTIILAIGVASGFAYTDYQHTGFETGANISAFTSATAYEYSPPELRAGIELKF